MKLKVRTAEKSGQQKTQLAVALRDTYSLAVVAILLIGDEILSASVREANLHPMLTTLTDLGYQVGEVRIVRDSIPEIASAFRELHDTYQYVFSAGGIGPTHDDLTIEAACRAFGASAGQHPHMRRFLEGRYGTPLSAMVARMAELPAGTEVIGWEQGRWPIIRWDTVFILPGLPRALLDKMERLRTTLPTLQRFWAAEFYLSVDESDFADWLDDVRRSLAGVTIGSYPVYGEDYVARIVVRAADRDAVRGAAATLRDYVTRRGWLLREGGDADADG